MSNKRPGKLNEFEIAAALAPLGTWRVERGKLHRDYQFKDFTTAFAFMTGAALIAQGMDHHPDWSNAWNKVRVDLSTHDADGITSLDVELARAMEALATRLSGP
jgi:4a-hydroxytetrahydrobiopterin dehydratase